MPTTPVPVAVSEKSRGVTLALAAVLGPFGGHRFYLGRTRSAVLMALTVGGVGLWWLYDLIIVAAGSFTDSRGRLVRRWDVEEQAPEAPLAAEVLDELDMLRLQVADLAERVEFAERLLARPSAGDRVPPSAIHS